MEGFFFAKDGVRALGTASSPDLSSRLFRSMTDSKQPAQTTSWIREHEALYTWLREMPRDQRPAFLVRVARNIENIDACNRCAKTPGSPDTVLSVAVLLEYADHLGVDPRTACRMLEEPEAELPVDRMLDDASRKRSAPIAPDRRGDDADSRGRVTRGISGHWKATPGRRGADRREDVRPTGSGEPRLVIRGGEPARRA